MADTFISHRSELNAPARNAFAVTPHATNELTAITRGLYVGGAGDITCRLVGDSADVTFVGVPVGSLLPVRASHVRITGTTATNIVAIY